MAHTDSQASVMHMIKNVGYISSDNQRYKLRSVYECINSSDADQDGVYWMLFFDEAHDDMENNPFVYEYLKVFVRDGKADYEVGDLVSALRTRSHAHHVLYMKYGSDVAGLYIEELEHQDGVLGWAQQFRDPVTGSLRRLELIEDMELFIQAIDNPTIEDVELGDTAADVLDAKANDYADRRAFLAEEYGNGSSE